ncbi:MAG: DUF3488 and transglutaminase-like domain-containing protein, partial [Actinobacteria bacterium]|nr:DUF3488 and transglutaminase-like domain-containing protein [Actinomycetota bacterium]
AVLVAVLAAALSVTRAGIGGPFLVASVVLGIPAGFATAHLTRGRAHYVRKAVVALLALAVFVRFLASAAGVPVNELTRLRVPLAELFLWVQVVYSFDLGSRRDLLLSLLSSLVLLMLGGAVSTSLAFGAHLAVWAAAAVTTLVLSHRRQVAELPGLSPGPAGAGAGAAGPAARAVAGAVAGVGAVGLVAFVLVPPSGSARVLPLPAQAQSALVPNPGGIWNPSLGDAQRSGSPVPAGTRTSFGYFGFARSLDMAARGRPDATPVMRVRAARPDFWRGQSFDVWDGRQWTISNERPTVVRGSVPLDVPPSRDDAYAQYRGDVFIQTYFLQRPGPNVFFSAYKADELYFPVPSVFVLSDGTLRSGVEMGRGTVYSVVSRRPHVTAEVLRAATASAPMPPGFLARYTELPVQPARIAALAAEVTAGAPTVYDKVLALERWMSEHTLYSLDIPPLPPRADAVDQFLFVDRRGFCEQIGTSLVVMLRGLGVPARLAVGYGPGQRDPFTGLWQVRAKDAHAWAEVYFPGVGWQGFDPTASVPLSGEAAAPGTAAALATFMEARLGPLAGWWPVAAAAGAVPALVRLLRSRRRRAARRRGGRPPRRWVDTYIRRLEQGGRRRGAPRMPTETVREYVGRLDAGVFRDAGLPGVVPVVEGEQFSGRDAPDEDRRRAQRVL